LQGLGHYADAIREFETAVELKPDYFDALVNLGEAYIEINRNQEAISLLRKAIGLHSDAIEARDLLGVALFRSDDRQGAVEQFKTLNELDPKYSGLVKKLLNSDPQI